MLLTNCNQLCGLVLQLKFLHVLIWTTTAHRICMNILFSKVKTNLVMCVVHAQNARNVWQGLKSDTAFTTPNMKKETLGLRAQINVFFFKWDSQMTPAATSSKLDACLARKTNKQM